MHKICFLLYIVSLFLVMSGCTKNKITEKKLVGEWNTTEWRIGNNATFNLISNDQFTSTITIFFADNGSFDVHITGNSFEKNFTGTWNLSGDRLEMNYDSADGVAGNFIDNISSATEIYTIIGLTKSLLGMRGGVDNTTVVITNNR